jgi:ABC-type sugar transport system permease subunit
MFISVFISVFVSGFIFAFMLAPMFGICVRCCALQWQVFGLGGTIVAVGSMGGKRAIGRTN